jgi:RNA polymerase sigma factor (sigma-70 family)
MGDSMQQIASIGHNRPPDSPDAKTVHLEAAYTAFNKLVWRVVGRELRLSITHPEVQDVAQQAWMRVLQSGYVTDVASHLYHDGDAIPLIEDSPTYQSARANVLVQTRRALLDYYERKKQARDGLPIIELTEQQWAAIAEQPNEISEGPKWHEIVDCLVQLDVNDQDRTIMETHYVLDLSIRDTAKYLELNRKTVENTINRIKLILRNHYGVTDHGS